MQLRDYQEKTHNMTLEWLGNNSGNVCVELPTGGGKSLIIAYFCQWALQNYPETRILILSHVKEILEQNAGKIKTLWPNAPLGIFSASLKRKQLDEPITIAGIQSVRTRAKELGHFDIVIIDECHLINHKDEGGYRQLLKELHEINPYIRTIGYTATPYRLGHGLITDKPAIFDEIITPTSIEELVHKGYLSPLKSKHRSLNIDIDSIKKRGGEFIESEIEALFDTEDNNVQVVQEVLSVARTENCKSWLFFCSGVDHAENVKSILCRMGVVAECVTGKTSKLERERIIKSFQAGEIQALTNCDVLTIGFDAPNIDLIVMLRPTMSPALYVQMAGRGTRLKEHTDYCRVLDYAGNVARHGAITAVIPPPKKGEKKGTSEPPMKICDYCAELVAPSVRVCPCCNNPFPEPEKPPMKLHNDDIMGIEADEMVLEKWHWSPHVSKASGKLMLKVSYYGEDILNDPIVNEFLAITHDGYAGQKARRSLMEIMRNAGVINEYQEYTQNPSYYLEDELDSMTAIADILNNGFKPELITYKRDGNFFRVLERIWA